MTDIALLLGLSPLLALACWLAVLVSGAVRAGSARRAVDSRETPPETADFPGIEAALSVLVRIPTVSRHDEAATDPRPFADFPPALERVFPLAFSRFLRHEAGDRAILLEWPGRTSGPGALLASHWDVVPPGDEAWARDPFSGDVEDGFVHGRGAQDTKSTLVAALSAAESLLASGFTPERTVWFAFGGDEEIGGGSGAARIAETLSSLSVSLRFVLDEGNPVAIDALPALGAPLALVGVAEKGYADIAIEAPGSGGHASMPPRSLATVELAKAVVKLCRRRFPVRRTRTLELMLRAIAPRAPFLPRLLFASPRAAFLPLVAAFGRASETDALLRSTVAITMLSGSDKENVLPSGARAIANVRIIPGETVASALARIRGLAAPLAVHVAREGSAYDPSAESRADGPDWDALRRAAETAFPGVVVAPGLFCAGTDSKHYASLAADVYRFTPLAFSRADLAGIHGANERVSADNLRRAAVFYRALMSSL